MLTFDEATHTYTLRGRNVPSVTQVIDEIIGEAIFKAPEWYLWRGRAVHACAALVALGKPFEHDPQIAGQVKACRQWFADMKAETIDVEMPVYSELYQFAGTLDWLGQIKGKRVIVDWKTQVTEVAKIQLGGYSVCTGVRTGMVVRLGEDGKYRASSMIDLRPFARDFLALRSAYSVRQRLGLIKKEGQNDRTNTSDGSSGGGSRSLQRRSSAGQPASSPGGRPAPDCRPARRIHRHSGSVHGGE